MVNIVFTVVSLAVLVVAMVTKGNLPQQTAPQNETEVLSAAAELSPTPIPTPEPTEIATSSASPVPSITPSPILFSMNEWVYGGQITEKSVTESAVSFSTMDTAKAITAWYRERMVQLGYNPKSVIQTQSLEKVLDKLVGSGVKGTVSVEIAQDTKDAPVHVTVTVIPQNADVDSSVSVNNSI